MNLWFASDLFWDSEGRSHKMLNQLSQIIVRCFDSSNRNSIGLEEEIITDDTVLKLTKVFKS